MKRARLLLADDHKIFLDGLRHILEPHFEVAGTVRNGRDLQSAVKRLHPDVAVVDISMPLLNGIDAIRKLKKTNPHVKTVLLTMHREVAFAAEAFRAGASGYVLKDAESDELIEAIREVLAGRFYLTPLITKETLGELMQGASGGEPALTPRQREVLQLLSDGYKFKEVASALHISISTVEFHKAEIMRRLGITSTADLIRYSIAQGMVPAR
jgi:DNA-binding NarL/FixJ family response regulator